MTGFGKKQRTESGLISFIFLAKKKVLKKSDIGLIPDREKE